jgi:hypothetical protein
VLKLSAFVTFQPTHFRICHDASLASHLVDKKSSPWVTKHDREFGSCFHIEKRLRIIEANYTPFLKILYDEGFN